AGEQARDSAARASRQAPGAWLLPEVIKGVFGQCFDMNRQGWSGQVHLPLSRFRDASAHFTFYLWRGKWEALVRASRRDADGGGAQVAEVVEDLSRDRVDVERRASGDSEVGHTEDV